MEKFEPVTTLIIAANLLISIKGFQDRSFFEKNLFEVGKVLYNKEYKRLFMSGFLHGDWAHLLFNMISFYSFSGALEMVIGPVNVLIIYSVSLFGGDLLALFIHRDHPYYRAVGASGAVSGIIFSAIAIFPGMEVGFFFVPIPIPGWLFALIYILYSIYGMKNRVGNIGHEAHLGGALLGLAVTIAMEPLVLENNAMVVGLMIIPSIIFVIMLIVNPRFPHG